MSDALTQAFCCGKLVLATITYNAEIFPFMRDFIHHLTERNFQNRTVGLIENGSWAPHGRQAHAQHAGPEQEHHLHRHHGEASCPP